MRSKIVVVSWGLALLCCVSLVGCGKKAAPPAPPPSAMTVEKAKELIAIMEGNTKTGPFGMDVQASAAERLGEAGQVAKDAGAIPALTKLSKSSKASKEAKEKAAAALAKLNGAAPAP